MSTVLSNDYRPNLLMRIVAVLGVISPILFYYNIPLTSLSVTTTINALFVLLALLTTRKIEVGRKSFSVYMFVYLLWFTGLTVFLSLLGKYTVELNMTFLNAIFVGIAIIWLSGNYSISETIIQAYRIICIIVMFLYALQFIGDVVGIHFNFKIPLLSIQPFYQAAFNIYSAGLFSEPAHLAQFIAPLLCIYLFDGGLDDPNHRRALIISGFCILSMSGSGIVICAIIWLCYFIHKAHNGGLYGLAYFIGGCALLFIVFIILMKIPSIATIINKLFFDKTGLATYSKADYRIYRGFDYFFQLPIKDKIVGIGYKALDAYKALYGIKSKYDTYQLSEYLNSVCQVLVYTGIIGFLIIAKAIISLYKDNCTAGKIVIITFIALSVSSSIFLDNTMMMFVLIISALKNRNIHLQEENI